MKALKENIPYHCIRFLLFTINLVLCICGFLILSSGLGAIFSRETGFYPPKTESKIIGAPEIITSFGGIIAVISLLGTFSIAQESQSVLLTHMILMLILCACELVVGTLTYLKIDFLTSYVQNDMIQGAEFYPIDPQIASGWDSMQRLGNCCGIDSFRDWAAMENVKNPQNQSFIDDNFFTCGDFKVPLSCQNLDVIIRKDNSQSDCYLKGCFKTGIDFVQERIIPIGIVTMAVFMLQLLALLMAVILYGLKKLRLAGQSQSDCHETLLGSSSRNKDYGNMNLVY